LNRRALTTGAVILLFLLGLGVYAPGLNSLLLFDDFPNLNALSVISAEPLFSQSFWEFVLNGGAGPLGRPLSLFTFALQADAWPANPFAFKAVNLLLHLGNAALVLCICRELARLLRLNVSSATLFCIAVAALWMLHPIHSTTVLFTVQRMTVLASTFMLLGVWAHLRLREQVAQATEVRALVRPTLSLAVTGLLALLSKELAPVLLCFLLALEYTVLAAQPCSRLFRTWRYVCLWLPLLLLALIALLQWNNLQQSYADMRSFTLVERLLTEARVLWTYLATLVTPSTTNLALFQQPALSTSLWRPFSTLPAVLAWCVVFGLAVRQRRLWPWFSLAVFWYLGGHLLESTVVPLELKFNHRNYLAILGPLLGAGYALTQLQQSGRVRQAGWALSGVLCLLLSFQTWQQSRLWTQPLELAHAWYVTNPQDTRNVEFFILQLAEPAVGDADQAAALYQQLIEANPGDHRFVLNRMLLGCRYPALPPLDPGLITTALLAPAHHVNDLASPLAQLVSLAASQTCTNFDIGLLTRLAESAQAVSAGDTKGLVAFELGRLALLRGQTEAAFEWFRQAYALTQDPGILFAHAQQLLQQRNFAEALVLLDEAQRRVEEHNNIATGTRDVKRRALAGMREYAIQASAEPSP
jgi:tetratricopeptide (TPR) repeat protein